MSQPRGRRPKPTKLKVLTGNPGRRPLNENEASPQSVKMRCPSWIKGEARREFRRKVRQLEPLGLLTEIDDAEFINYCTSYGRMVELEKFFQENGVRAMLYETKNGNKIMSPLYCCLLSEKDKVHKFVTEFGMTPSSRSRVRVEVPEKESTFSKFLNAKK